MTLLLLLAWLWAPRAQVAPPGGSSLDAARAQERTVLGELQQIDEQLGAAQAELQALEERVRELDAAKTRRLAELAETRASVERQREQVRRWLVQLYRLHRRGLARVVFGSADPTELRRTSRYLQALVAALMDHLRAWSRQADQQQALVDAIDRDMEAIASLQAEVRGKRAELQARRKERVALLDRVRSQRTLALQALSEMSAVRADLDDSLASPGASRGGGSRATRFQDLHGRLPWPTTGRVIRRFGPYVDPTTGERARSMGIDIAADYGSPVRAVFDGVVALARHLPGYGQVVALEHGPYATVYAHLASIRVRQGQAVEAGDVIGLVGNTGLTEGSGYVLTFEVRYNTTAQDPLDWLAPQGR